MAINNFDDLINSFNYSQVKAPTKYGVSNGSVTGYWNSSWTMTGSFLAPTPPTGSGAACNYGTTGRMSFENSTGGRKLYLARLMFAPNLTIGAYLMDRQWHCSGLNSNIATPQTINSAPLPTRAGTGEDNELWLEVYSNLGTNGRSYTVTYTNSDNVSGRTAAVILPGSVKATMTFRVPLQSGDTGVKSIQSVILNAGSGVVGDFGLTLCKRITTIAAPIANSMYVISGLSTTLPVIDNNCCLYFITNASSSTSPTYDSEVTLVEA